MVWPMYYGDLGSICLISAQSALILASLLVSTCARIKLMMMSCCAAAKPRVKLALTPKTERSLISGTFHSV